MLWLKALHIVAMVTWMGGMMVLSLALGSLAKSEASCGPQAPRYLLVVRQWDRTVTGPALLLTWVLGFAMAIQAGWLTAHWLQVKGVLALALAALHGVMSGTLRRALGDAAAAPWEGFRHAGGAVVLTVAAIALLVVLKPI